MSAPLCCFCGEECSLITDVSSDDEKHHTAACPQCLLTAELTLSLPKLCPQQECDRCERVAELQDRADPENPGFNLCLCPDCTLEADRDFEREHPVDPLTELGIPPGYFGP